ncbi:hypothetical protein BB560_005462 [Smittium megazygosporum]|uniref:VHS domain-containing protein n=1 Tax=Smittium megazygosporum TaxID=133381 RepID=A0A2T9Z577_9FUNG|nr:hypothetical protein BB560_005462 [Smittium megazygosporum]
MSFNLQQALDDLLKPPTKLQSMIDQACSLDRTRQDLALNLEICDYVNQKKANNPHEAVFSLLPYINSKSQKQALLALGLLDNLVKNCGHAVHFQIASKDFLNSLVRKFPEFQPEWRYTLCENSRYKEDLVKIKDMCNLLKRKRWRFPEYCSDNSAIILGPQNTVKSQQELENEDLEAMQAKLQELLRRATPHDLREANKLMKIITGYERTSKKFDYDKQFSDELDSLETKAELLKDIIQNMDPYERLDETGQELASACVSNINKISKLTDEYKLALEDLDLDESNNDSEEYHIYTRLNTLHSLLVEVIKAVNDIGNGIPPSFTENVQSESLIMLGDDEDDGASSNIASSSMQNTPDLLSQNPSEAKTKNVKADLLGLDFMDATSSASPILAPLKSSSNPGPSVKSDLLGLNGSSQTNSYKPNYNVDLKGLSIGNTNSVSPGQPLKYDFNKQTVSENPSLKKKPDLFDFGNILETGVSSKTQVETTGTPKTQKDSTSGSLATSTNSSAIEFTSSNASGPKPSQPDSNTGTVSNLIDLL